jgi:puromycin-sensitive aminopeptidase
MRARPCIAQVRSQDAVFVIIAVADNPAGRDLAWAFVQEHWKALVAKYQGGFLLNRLVKGVSSVFASEAKAQEIAKFFEANPCPSANRALDQALEIIRNNEKWLARDKDAIRAYLTERQ